MALVVALLAALPFIADAIGQPALTSLATRITILAIAAASLNLALGYCGLVSFGHAAWYGIGGYVVGIMWRHHVSGDPFLGMSIGSDQLLVTLPLAILISGLFALALGALSLRTSGVQFIMITLAFAQMLFFFFVALKTYGGDDGLIVRRRNALPFIDTRDGPTFYWVCLAFALAWFALMARIVKSRFGKVLRRHPPERAAHGRHRRLDLSLQARVLRHFGHGRGARGRADGQPRALRLART